MVAATVETFNALDEDTDVWLSHPKFIGSALVAREQVVHLSAFPAEIAQSQPRPRFRA